MPTSAGAGSLLVLLLKRSAAAGVDAQVKRVCACTGASPLTMYLSFIENFVRNEINCAFPGDACDVGAPHRSSLTSAAEIGSHTKAAWSASDPRRLLLLHALRGAQEAADAEEQEAKGLRCPWLAGLLQVGRCMLRNSVKHKMENRVGSETFLKDWIKSLRCAALLVQ